MKEHMRNSQQDYVIVVESPFTALYLKSLGFHNVVATFGSFGRLQSMLLIGIPKVYFWPDNDGAGKTNVENAIEYLSKLVQLYIVPIVDKEKGDAADLSNANIIQKYIDKAYPYTLYPIVGMATIDDLS